MQKSEKYFDVELKVSRTQDKQGNFLYDSEYISIKKLLLHLARLSRAECSRRLYLRTVKHYLKEIKIASPDSIIALSREQAQDALQLYLDTLNAKNSAHSSLNVTRAILLVFHEVNGFKREKELEVPSYHVAARARFREEYVPTKQEVWRMADACGGSLAGLRNKAMILAYYGIGFRNSTLRALLYRDIKKEFEHAGPEQWISVPCYVGMKKAVTSACKNNIPYYSFLFPEAIEALRVYFERRVEHEGKKIEDTEPVFKALATNSTRSKDPEVLLTGCLTKKSVEDFVHDAARNAGIEKWKLITPHCLRKTYESVLRSKNSQSGALLADKEQEFFLGHILPGSQDKYFTEEFVDELKSYFVKLPFGRNIETKSLKELETKLDASNRLIEQYRNQQSSMQALLVQNLIATKQIESVPLDVLRRAGLEIIKNPDGSFTAKPMA